MNETPSPHPASGASPIITELAKAMIKVQQSLSPASKDAENPFVNKRYATLNSVMDACREGLIANGIWVAQYPVPVETGHLGLVTKLVHAESGQWQSSLMVMPLPKADPQGYGSALTYARRYGLATMVGLVTEADDDAEGAMPRSGNRPAKAQAATGSRKESAQASSARSGTMATVAPQPPAQRNEKQGERPGSALAALPRIDGITYQTVQAQDGRTCVTASGDTRSKKALLQEAGFRWDATRKVWWRYADAQAA